MAVKRKSRVRGPSKFDKARFFKTLGILLVLFCLSAGGLFVTRHVDETLHALEEFVAKTVGAKVEHIMVQGLVHTDSVELMEALGLSKGMSLVGFNSAAVRERVESLPWIQNAVVERKLPSTVRVELFEYQPFARLEVEEDVVSEDDASVTVHVHAAKADATVVDVYVINKNGDKIEKAGDKFDYLPLLIGDGVGDEASNLFAWMASYPKMREKLAQAKYVGERRWDLGFESGVTVQLPEKDPASALSLLSRLDEKRHVLLMKGGMVDLRLEDRIVIRLPEGQKPSEQLL